MSYNSLNFHIGYLSNSTIKTNDNSLKKNKKSVNDENHNNFLKDLNENEYDNDSENSNLTENEKIFRWLNKYISGQDEAKKALITIISCRDRRNKLPENELKQAIKPSHAIFHGPTGCGKSYLISKLSEYKNIPFIKTEATQYTEVGYVGRDVEMMVKDLMENAVSLVRKKHINAIKSKVDAEVYHQLTIVIMKSMEAQNTNININDEIENHDDDIGDINKILNNDKYQEIYDKLINGDLDDFDIELEVPDENSNNTFEIPGLGSTIQMSSFNINDIMNKVLGKKDTKIIKTKVKDAIDLKRDDESDRILNEAQIIKEAKYLAQNHGIIFIDEIDKIISSTNNMSNRGDVSKEGVQRDLLPLLDGTRINTKYGPIRTDHILFIAAGAFHVTKFSDLVPELQGRFPMSVKLHPLEEHHFVDILNNKKHSLIKQHQAMLEVDKVKLIFTENSITTIAKITAKMNQDVENTGARRLRTIIDKILEDIHFNAEKYHSDEFIVDQKYVEEKVGELTNDIDLKKFIL